MPQFGRFDRAAELVEAIRVVRRRRSGAAKAPRDDACSTWRRSTSPGSRRRSTRRSSPTSVANLQPINAVADASPGFIWRLQTEEGDATSLRFSDDEWLIVNMSVWSRSMRCATTSTARRTPTSCVGSQEWFERMSEAFVALWWIEAGTLPTIERCPRAFGRAPRRRSDAVRVHAEAAVPASAGRLQRHDAGAIGVARCVDLTAQSRAGRRAPDSVIAISNGCSERS